MVGILGGVKFNQLGSETVAGMSCGEVKSSTVYEKLTARLATPDRFQKLDALTGPTVL